MKGSYYTISNTANGSGSYMATQSSYNDGWEIITSSSVNSNSLWVFEEYTGPVIHDVGGHHVNDRITRGQTFDYDMYMCSSVTGVNGPIIYSVHDENHNTTNLATINSSTGVLTATGIGTITIGITYNGAPWTWYWTIYIRTAGCRPYESVTSDDINCHGYAFDLNYKPTDWVIPAIIPFALDSDDLMDGLTGEGYNIIGFKQMLENWMSRTIPGRYRYAGEGGDGWDYELADDEWLIAYRVGLYYNGYGQPDADYHFWYRTDEGKWANKHGSLASELLESDLPSDNDSTGWAAPICQEGTYTVIGYEYGLYDSKILFYIIKR